MDSKYGIITGDIVSSRGITPAVRDKLYTDLARYLGTLKGQYIRSYETYRGDSIQCEALSVALSLRTALMIRTFVLSYHNSHKAVTAEKEAINQYPTTRFDIRLAVGIGAVDFINRKKVASSDGEAFRLSGETLDSLKEENERLAFSTWDQTLTNDLQPMVVLLDAIAQKWTQNQAQLIFNKLQHKRDEEIAKALQISLSAVNQRKKTAQWHAIEKAVLYFENKMTHLL